MNIGIIGSGAREHSICYKLKQSKIVKNLYCIPGNAGTSEICNNINININNFDEIYKVVIAKKIELIVVGPEEPLVNGITDFFEKKNINIFGPSKMASRLEGSKAFMKGICKEFAIPSAKYEEINNLDEANKALEKFKVPIVVKSDALAGGKGVTICNTKQDAFNDIKNILSGKFEKSKKVIIEEFLQGEEASYFVVTDGENYIPIGTAQDHKRIGENDTGLNTGGMGAYSPSFLISKEVDEKIKKTIIEPTINAMKAKGCPYKGILYAGLMINKSQPKLIEYNIRFGDPECQVLMMRLNNDLLEIIQSTLNKKLDKIEINWNNDFCMTIVAASKGYPEKFEKLKEIKNISEFGKSSSKQLFHASTIKGKDGKIYSNGGRVLSSTVLNRSLKEARKEALKILDSIDWENKYYRRDIGYRIIDK